MTSTRHELATLLFVHSLASHLLGETKTGSSKRNALVCPMCALAGKWCSVGCNCGHDWHSRRKPSHPAEKWQPPVKGRMSCKVHRSGLPIDAKAERDEVDR